MSRTTRGRAPRSSSTASAARRPARECAVDRRVLDVIAADVQAGRPPDRPLRGFERRPATGRTAPTECDTSAGAATSTRRRCRTTPPSGRARSVSRSASLGRRRAHHHRRDQVLARRRVRRARRRVITARFMTGPVPSPFEHEDRLRRPARPARRSTRTTRRAAVARSGAPGERRRPARRRWRRRPRGRRSASPVLEHDARSTRPSWCRMPVTRASSSRSAAGGSAAASCVGMAPMPRGGHDRVALRQHAVDEVQHPARRRQARVEEDAAEEGPEEPLDDASARTRSAASSSRDGALGRREDLLGRLRQGLLPQRQHLQLVADRADRARGCRRVRSSGARNGSTTLWNAPVHAHQRPGHEAAEVERRRSRARCRASG